MWLIALVAIAALPKPFTAIVLGVNGRGSTLYVARTGKATFTSQAENVALTDVISPWVMQRGSSAAEYFAIDLLLGEEITVTPTGRAEDDDGPFLVARVKLGATDVGEALVQAGHAWVKPEARTNQKLTALEAEARAAKRGLWAERNPLEPWLWHELTMLGDKPNKHVHSGWECPFVQATKCKDCGGLRFYSLEEARAAGFTPHDVCMKEAEIRIAESSGEPEGVERDDDNRRLLPRSPRRACKVDKDCAVAPMTPCTCPPCGHAWREAARADVVQRMKKNFARAACGGVGCPACATMWGGTKAVCKDEQCRSE